MIRVKAPRTRLQKKSTMANWWRLDGRGLRDAGVAGMISRSSGD